MKVTIENSREPERAYLKIQAETAAEQVFLLTLLNRGPVAVSEGVSHCEPTLAGVLPGVSALCVRPP